MIKENKINFDDLRNLMNITDENAFLLCIEDICNGLNVKSDSLKPQEEKFGISKRAFHDFLRVNVFISNKIFLSLANNKKEEYITKEAFIKFLVDLYLGDFNTTAKLIFNIFDYDKDGIITIKDVIHLLSFLPLKKPGEEEIEIESKYQLESLTKLEKEFKGKVLESELSFDNYLESIKHTPDLFLQLLCYMYLSIPIQSESLWMYEKVFWSKNDLIRNRSNSDKLDRFKQFKKNFSIQSPISQNHTPKAPKLSINSVSNLSPLEDFISTNDNPTSKARLKLNKAIRKLEVRDSKRRTSHIDFRNPKHKISVKKKNSLSKFFPADRSTAQKTTWSSSDGSFKNDVQNFFKGRRFTKESICLTI